MRYLRKDVYECSELVGRSRKEAAAQIEVKSKLKKNLFGYIKNLLWRRDKLSERADCGQNQTINTRSWTPS